MEGIISNLHFIVYNSGSLKKTQKITWRRADLSCGGELGSGPTVQPTACPVHIQQRHLAHLSAMLLLGGNGEVTSAKLNILQGYNIMGYIV
jgi:hypothetical protein